MESEFPIYSSSEAVSETIKRKMKQGPSQLSFLGIPELPIEAKQILVFSWNHKP